MEDEYAFLLMRRARQPFLFRIFPSRHNHLFCVGTRDVVFEVLSRLSSSGSASASWASRKTCCQSRWATDVPVTQRCVSVGVQQYGTQFVRLTTISDLCRCCLQNVTLSRSPILHIGRIGTHGGEGCEPRRKLVDFPRGRCDVIAFSPCETLLVLVKGINPASHIHEHLRYTIMATALRTPSRITTSCLSTLR